MLYLQLWNNYIKQRIFKVAVIKVASDPPLSSHVPLCLHTQ